MQQPLTSNARKLRKKSTDVEILLWSKLRSKRFENLKWRRQFPIGSYIVDFCCPEKMLVVECDGSQHIPQEAYDKKRTDWLKSQGYKVMRFWNNEVLENISGVLESIKQM